MGIDKQYYADAALEVSGGHIDAALYVKALAMAGGEDKKAQAVYIGLRAEELQSEARKATAAKAVGTAAGLAVGTTQAAVVVARHLPFRKILAVLAALAGAWIAFILSLLVAGGIMEEMRYDMNHPLNIVPLLLGSAVVALAVSWILGKAIWPKETTSLD